MIHSTAVVRPGAEISPDAEIGPYAVIGAHVKIGPETRLLAHVVVDGHTTIGRGCLIYPGACLGFPAQDKKYKGERSYVVIGDDNIFREHVTVNAASKPEAKTVIGDRNYFMIGSHVGHDCVLGSDITMANGSALGGFVDVEDRATIGGFAAVHQNVRVGRLSMLGAKSKAVMDVPPFSMCDGYPAKFRGLNSIGLRRAGFTSEQSLEIRKALKTLFGSGLSLPNAVEQVRAGFPGNADIGHILSFIGLSRRGVSRLEAEE